MTAHAPGWLAVALESLGDSATLMTVPPEFTTGVCAELGRLNRMKAADRLREDGAAQATMERLQRLVRTRPELVEWALAAVAHADLAARVEQYIAVHPSGDDEDHGLALLFELDRSWLVAAVASDVQSRLSAPGRRALARVERDLRVAVRLVRRASWSFAPWRNAIVGYCEDEGIASDHPLVELLERTSGEGPALIAAGQMRRETAVAARKAAACEQRAATAAAGGRTAQALEWLRQALRVVPGRAATVDALRDLLSVAGRPIEFPVVPGLASVRAAGVEHPPIALRYGEPAGTTVTLAENAEGVLLAVVEDGGRAVEGAVVALVEIRPDGAEHELVTGATDPMGEANLGPAQAFAEMLGVGPRRAKVKVMAPPRDAPETV